jgi:hypothetical protein
MIPKLTTSYTCSPFVVDKALQPQQQLEEELQIERRAEEALTYDAFAAFIRCVANVQDADISPRWFFGQVRLSRLY